MKKKVTTTRKREVHTYSELWAASTSLLIQGRAEEEGSYYQSMGSLVFTAFSLEAFFNHIGPKVLNENWSDQERLGPNETLHAEPEPQSQGSSRKASMAGREDPVRFPK